jgi:carboxyl-terminal processing protease
MLNSLDEHSMYLSADDFREMQDDTRGEFGGLGIEISMKDNQLTVVSPIEGTPADKAGILSGDVIAFIEDKPTAKMNLIEAVKMMRGKPGTAVKLKIKREGLADLVSMEVVRAIIQSKSVTAELKEDGIGMIRLRSFSEKSSIEVKEALDNFRKEIKAKDKDDDLRALILDLRSNPGGLLQQAVEVSDLFLDEGLIVYTQGRDKERVSRSFANSPGTEPDYPMVVLINGGSASASEIVAGALQDQSRAHILGMKSFGKASVQHVRSLEDGSGIKLTVGHYYTPSGRQIHGEGISPDQKVLGPFDRLEEEESTDGDISSSSVPENPASATPAKAPEEKKSEPAVATPGVPGEEVKDLQMEAAMEYLRGRVAMAR